MTPVLCFDIETVPDTALGRQLLGLDAGLSDEDVAKAMTFKRLQEAETEFLPLFQQRVVAISVLLRHDDQLRLWTLGDNDSDEADLISRFYHGVEQYLPELVSWNGSGFDLPVIHYRSLLYPIEAAHYWENGQNDSSFRYNNYLSRYHERHTDLMDVLAGFSPRANAPLDEIASLCGFPGKMGMSGANVWETYLEGNIQSIRDYCETDVLNTYLVYLNYERNRGNLDQIQYVQECQLVRDTLKASDHEHLQAFEKAWIDL